VSTAASFGVLHRQRPVPFPAVTPGFSCSLGFPGPGSWVCNTGPYVELLFGFGDPLDMLMEEKGGKGVGETEREREGEADVREAFCSG
jgi:hypothetical protein